MGYQLLCPLSRALNLQSGFGGHNTLEGSVPDQGSCCMFSFLIPTLLGVHFVWVRYKNCKKGHVPRDHESAPGFACDASEFFFGIQRHPANTLCLKTRGVRKCTIWYGKRAIERGL